MKTKVVVFDWDGVLCNSAEIYVQHFNTVLAHYGKEPVTLWEFRESAKTTNKEFFLQYAIKNTEEATRRFIALTRKEPRPNLFPDVHDTLRWLSHRGIETRVVSGHPKKDIERVLKLYGLDGMITNVKGGVSVPDKIQSLADVIIEKGITADELVFVDDMDEILKLAREIGCYVVGSARGFCSYTRLANAEPDKIMHNLKGLEGFINWIHHIYEQRHMVYPVHTRRSGK
ncbi:MAG: HAD family hydrolase [bacterium]|nr:HAD family hydrolase [bacterium]